MNWFYAEGKQQMGPVSDSQLDELLRSGKISPTTLIWREGMGEWQPLNIARAGTQPGAVCAECGKAFPPDEIIRLNNSMVCAGCKPIFLQRMAENVPLPASGTLWRANKRIVARTETVFPDRCVKCNQSAGGYRLKRTLYWMYPAWWLLLIISRLILIIVYFVVRKKAIVHVGLCERHRAKRKLWIIIAWSSVAVSILLFICAGLSNSPGWFVAIGILTLLGGGITGALLARTVWPTKIDKEYVWLGGAHRDFLAELPEWNGP